MTLVALQPSASAAARKHFDDTIETSVSVDLAAQLLPASVAADLRRAHPDGAMKVWGAKPGERYQQVAKWSRLRPGDYIAFAAEGRLFAGATITRVFRSEDLARELWGQTTTANGVTQTWELMFSLADVEYLDVPYAVMNPLIGRSLRANVQEFAVLGESASAALLEYINRTESSYVAPAEHRELPPVILAGLEETDRIAATNRRLEQQALKRALIAGWPRSRCELCGREMATEFLTAAHIKRRSLCTDDERVMLTAVSMLACRFGCDELFGKGYVGVDRDGVIRVSELLTDPIARDYADERLSGCQSLAWQAREETHEFFAFHWEHDFRRPVTLAR